MSEEQFHELVEDMAKAINERIEANNDNVISIFILVNLINMFCVWLVTLN